MEKNTDKLSKLFESASKRKTFTSIPLICLLILSILGIILSALQTIPLDDDFPLYGSLVCLNDSEQYISPYHIIIKNPFGGTSTSTGPETMELACPWRLRNTIFRLIMICFCILVSFSSLIILFFKPNQTVWTGLYWLNWLLFAMMFVAFILDCDALNTGHVSCVKDFDLGGGSRFEVESCILTPYIWILFIDFFMSMICYCSYRISSYFIVDPVERKMSVQNQNNKQVNMTKTKNNNTNDTNDNNNVAATGAFEEYAGSYEVNNDNDANKKKDDSPDPFANSGGDAYDNNDQVGGGGGAYGGGAYEDNFAAYDE